MKRVNSIMCILIASLCFEHAFAGNEGHGGDIVRCSDSSENEFRGYYVLDNITALTNVSEKIKEFGNRDLDQRMELIITDLKEKSSFFAGALHIFYLDFKEQFLENSSRVIGAREWREITTPLFEFSDENLLYQLPSNCKNISQAVIRKKLGEKIQYYSNKKELLSKIKKENLTWLIVHEFLWDFTGNVEMIRQVNSYIHSREIKTDSKSYFVEFVKSLPFRDIHSAYILSQDPMVFVRKGDDIKMQIKIHPDIYFANSSFDLLLIGCMLSKTGKRKYHLYDCGAVRKDVPGSEEFTFDLGLVKPSGLAPHTLRVFRVLGGFRSLSLKNLGGETVDIDLKYIVNGKIIKEFSINNFRASERKWNPRLEIGASISADEAVDLPIMLMTY